MSCTGQNRIIGLLPVAFPSFAMPRSGRGGDSIPQDDGSERGPSPHDDLPFRVELWNEEKTSVEQVLTLTAHGSIGYAAYHAATREYPDRYVTLSHQNRILSRWNAKQ